MHGIILKTYLSSMLWHKFNEDIIMQRAQVTGNVSATFVFGCVKVCFKRKLKLYISVLREFSLSLYAELKKTMP